MVQARVQHTGLFAPPASHASPLFEEGFELIAQGCPFGLLRFALPDNHGLPAAIAKSRNISAVAIDVPTNLLSPVVGIGFRLPSSSWAVVPVPEATIDENDLAPAGEYQVGLSWQILAVESESETKPVDEPAHDHLRRRVL